MEPGEGQYRGTSNQPFTLLPPPLLQLSGMRPCCQALLQPCRQRSAGGDRTGRAWPIARQLGPAVPGLGSAPLDGGWLSAPSLPGGSFHRTHTPRSFLSWEQPWNRLFADNGGGLSGHVLTIKNQQLREKQRQRVSLHTLIYLLPILVLFKRTEQG